MKAELRIEVDTDSMVTLECTAIECKHNLVDTKDILCNLKNVHIRSDGRCAFYEEKK